MKGKPDKNRQRYFFYWFSITYLIIFIQASLTVYEVVNHQRYLFTHLSSG